MCVCPCAPLLNSCGAVHCLWWLWQCWWCQQWFRPGRRQRLLLWQWSQPWRWLQFGQWQRIWRWSQLCWRQQFLHQVHHHHVQQEGLLKSSRRLLVPHCLRPPFQILSFLFKFLLLSCYLLVVLELELRLLSALSSLPILAPSELPLLTIRRWSLVVFDPTTEQLPPAFH